MCPPPAGPWHRRGESSAVSALPSQSAAFGGQWPARALCRMGLSLDIMNSWIHTFTFQFLPVILLKVQLIPAKVSVMLGAFDPCLAVWDVRCPA